MGVAFTVFGLRRWIEANREIRQRRQAEQRISAQNQELETRNADISLLYKISSAITQTIELDVLLPKVIETILDIDILRLQRKGGILLIDGNKMDLAAYVGHTPLFLEAHKNITIKDCLCGLAARTGEIIVSNNSERDDRHTITYQGMEPHGHIIIPLKTTDRVAGVMYLYLPAEAVVDERTIKVLSAAGNQIGTAINNCQLHKKAKLLSLQDPLTKLANRNLMDIELEKNFARAKRFGSALSIIMMDLDNFKEYNDTYGHTSGDRVLVETAAIVLKEVREIDIAVRYGGEEFLIVLPDADIKDAYHVAERIRRAVEETANITISLGISAYSPKMERVHELINEADKALYQAKHKGKNRAEIWQG